MQIQTMYKSGVMLLRSIAVVSSSVATITSTMLPLFLFTSIPQSSLLLLFLLLTFGAFIIHGILTHSLNDYMDYHSGTDSQSPAILSGGSKVIQEQLLTPGTLRRIGIWLSGFLLTLAFIFALFSHYKVSILLVIGVWAAVSYSVSPLRLSYRPFLGEWLSLFPAILFLGLAGPWIMLDQIPLWAWQNAFINALFCLGWVMLHHIPDLEADKQAVPKKRTSVVWSAETFGVSYAKVPALLYFLTGGLCAFWLGSERLTSALIIASAAIAACVLIFKADMGNHHQVSAYEKILLLLAMISAVSLGLFV